MFVAKFYVVTLLQVLRGTVEVFRKVASAGLFHAYRHLLCADTRLCAYMLKLLYHSCNTCGVICTVLFHLSKLCMKFIIFVSSGTSSEFERQSCSIFARCFLRVGAKAAQASYSSFVPANNTCPHSLCPFSLLKRLPSVVVMYCLPIFSTRVWLPSIRDEYSV